MHKYLLLILFVSCSVDRYEVVNNEDMRLYVSSLGGGSGDTPLPPDIVDGGEIVAHTPEVPDGEPGRGYTNTGLHYCREESEARTDGKLVFWSANWGRKDNATAGGKFQGIAKIAIDYQEDTGGVTFPHTYTAELLDHMETWSLYTSNSMQGLMQRGNGGTVYISDGGLRGYQSAPDGGGTAIPVGSIGEGGPALAYDESNDTYLRGQSTTVERWSFEPNVFIENIPIDLSGITSIDHLHVNIEADILMVTHGVRGLKYFRYSTFEFLGDHTFDASWGIDIEGCALVKSHYDNKYYVFISSDNWFHADGNPDTDINAFFKVEPQITIP